MMLPCLTLLMQRFEMCEYVYHTQCTYKSGVCLCVSELWTDMQSECHWEPVCLAGPQHYIHCTNQHPPQLCFIIQGVTSSPNNTKQIWQICSALIFLAVWLCLIFVGGCTTVSLLYPVCQDHHCQTSLHREGHVIIRGLYFMHCNTLYHI